MSTDNTSPGNEHAKLESPTHGAVMLFIIAVCVAFLLVAAGTLFSLYTATHHTDVTRSQLQAVIAGQQRALHSDCAFFYPLAVAPLPAGVKPSKLGVSIITASRTAYLGHACGTLPPPGPSLSRWAAYYHLPPAR